MPSSEMPVAGENFTLTCTVYSDLPMTIMWFMISQQVNPSTGVLFTYKVDSSQKVMKQSDGSFVGKAYLELYPLLASHGSVYTCNSTVNITSKRRTASQTHKLKVKC